MKVIAYQSVVDAVEKMCQTAACQLPDDVYRAIQQSQKIEESPLGKALLGQLRENADLAAQEKVPICQDTGVAVYFVEYGTEVRLDGKTLQEAITEGTVKGYANGYLRKSMVKDPLFDRANTKTNAPPVIHWQPVAGDKLKITLAPKGGGSENMSAIAMLKPSAGKNGVTQFIVDTVKRAGGNPCPPVVVGVGLGGNFELAAYMAKKALLREVGSTHAQSVYADYERELLERINATGVGPQGLGGRTTALAVHIEVFACHIASLPVAVNLNCHAARHAVVEW